MSKKSLILILMLSVLYLSSAAQSPRELIGRRPQMSAGYYRSYDVFSSDSTAQSRPEGYEPFYISHYGRHGSRWHSSERKYLPVLEVLEKAAVQNALTRSGKELLSQVRIISEDAEGRYGELSPRGVSEHRGIAERMYLTYPEVFQSKDGTPASIDSKSTVVTRCILSMAAFNERLKEFRPEMVMTRESSKRNMWYMGNRRISDSLDVFSRARSISDSLRNEWIHPDRFIRSIFRDKKFVKKEIKNTKIWMYDVFQIAGIMESADYLGINLFGYFTDNELYDLWKCINAYAYMTMGPSLLFGEANLEDARPLLRNIVMTADEVISGKSDLDASLRFGHDSNIIPLLSLIGEKKTAARVSLDEVSGKWNLSLISPMATNLQFIFFKEEGKELSSSKIKVRVMHNERDAELPVEGAPFYDWTVLRKYLAGRL